MRGIKGRLHVLSNSLAATCGVASRTFPPSVGTDLFFPVYMSRKRGLISNQKLYRTESWMLRPGAEEKTSPN